MYTKRPTEINKQNLKEKRREYNKNLKKTRIEFYQKKIEDSKSDPKAFFKTLKKLTGYKNERVLPTNDTAENIANKMADFYQGKVFKIRNKLKLQNFAIIHYNMASKNTCII